MRPGLHTVITPTVMSCQYQSDCFCEHTTEQHQNSTTEEETAVVQQKKEATFELQVDKFHGVMPKMTQITSPQHPSSPSQNDDPTLHEE